MKDSLYFSVRGTQPSQINRASCTMTMVTVTMVSDDFDKIQCSYAIMCNLNHSDSTQNESNKCESRPTRLWRRGEESKSDLDSNTIYVETALIRSKQQLCVHWFSEILSCSQYINDKDKWIDRTLHFDNDLDHKKILT